MIWAAVDNLVDRLMALMSSDFVIGSITKSLTLQMQAFSENTGKMFVVWFMKLLAFNF